MSDRLIRANLSASLLALRVALILLLWVLAGIIVSILSQAVAGAACAAAICTVEGGKMIDRLEMRFCEIPKASGEAARGRERKETQ